MPGNNLYGSDRNQHFIFSILSVTMGRQMFAGKTLITIPSKMSKTGIE